MNAQFLKSMRAALIVLLSAHQAYAAPTCNQVVCADVVKSQKVATNKLCVSGDANFGGDVTIDGDLIVSGSIVNTMSPIEGWWLNTIKGNFTNNTVLWHIYHVGKTLRAKTYAGYQGRYREWTPEDFATVEGTFINWDSIPVDNFVLEPRAAGSWIINPIDPSSPEFWFPEQNQVLLNMSESNPNILYTNFEYLRLVRLNNAPEIETFDNPSFIDNTNPIKIVENVYNMLLLNGNPQFSVDVQASDYPGFAAFTARKNQLLTTGVTYHTTVEDVWVSRTDSPTGFSYPISTTFVTTDYSGDENGGPRLGARALVSGFLPPYDILNNNTSGWELGIADNENGRNFREVYGSEYFNSENSKYLLTVLDIDTSALPAYEPSVHGIGEVTIIVDPVTASTEYKQLTAALHDLQSFADRSTHTNVRSFCDFDTLRIYDTFADLQAGLDAGTALNYSFRSRGYFGTRTGAAYVDMDIRNVFTSPTIPSNDPTGITLYDGESPTAFYSIDIFNYLDPERTFNMYWGLAGDPVPGAPITTEKLVDFTQDFYGPGQPYYKTPGSKFVFTVDNYYNNYAFGNTPPDPNFWSIYSAGSYNDYNNLIFGILDPEKTCGETIAYISFLDFIGIDPAYFVSQMPNFTENGGYGPFGAGSDCFALMLETLNAYNPTTYIISNRGNGGGYVTGLSLPLMSFFGENRPGFDLSMSYADNGNHPGIRLQEFENDSNIGLQPVIDAYAQVDTNAYAERYPNAVVRNPGTKIIFVSDSNSASAGDLFPHFIRNNDAPNPGDIGTNIQSYIIGDIDGRLYGVGSNFMYLFTNTSNNLSENDVPVSPFHARLESQLAFTRNGTNSYVASNQNPVIAPDLLFNMDIENTLWLDIGSKGTYPLNPIDGGTDPLVLPLSAGVTQPVYGTDVVAQATWRDHLLEAAIMMAVPEGCFEEPVRDAKVNSKVKAQKAKLAEHLAKRPVQKPDPKREHLSDKH